MRKIRTFAALTLTVLLGQQLMACSAQVSANESEKLSGLWHGLHADVRMVVYDDLNTNLNRRKVAYHADLSSANDDVKHLLKGLAPDRANLHCDENSPIYVLEITEAGTKRRFSSDNNHCNNGVSYSAYAPAAAMAKLAQALAAQQPL